MDCCDIKKAHEVMKKIDIVYHCAATAQKVYQFSLPMK